MAAILVEGFQHSPYILICVRAGITGITRVWHMVWEQARQQVW